MWPLAIDCCEQFRRRVIESDCKTAWNWPRFDPQQFPNRDSVFSSDHLPCRCLDRDSGEAVGTESREVVIEFLNCFETFADDCGKQHVEEFRLTTIRSLTGV